MSLHFQDAFILAALLAHPRTNVHTLPLVAQIYDTVRRPFAQFVAKMSREAGMLYTFNFPGSEFPEHRDRSQDGDRLQKVYERIANNWKWAWETTVDGDLAKAVALLEGRK